MILKRAYLLSVALVLTACGSSGSGVPPTSGPSTLTTSVTTSVTSSTESTPTAAPDNSDPTAVIVPFDNPGAEPRPIREVPVLLAKPVSLLKMTITNLTYRGVACGFTFTGTRPSSPVTITIEGKTAVSPFTSGPVAIAWDDAGVVKAAMPQSSNGWSFSADAIKNRNGSGWVVTIGAVTADGPNSIPDEASCALTSSAQFEPQNGPVGYWAGFATR